jgi:class 3 adenylate cyclase
VDLALLIVLGALWFVCFGLHLRQLARGGLGWVPVYVHGADDEHSYPVVTGFWSGAPTDARGLSIGDRVLGVGEAALQGAGSLAFVAQVYSSADAELRVPIRFERGAQARETRLELIPVAAPWRLTVLALTLAAVGTAVLWRGGGSRFARTVFVTLIAFALHWSYFFGGSRLQTYAAALVFGAAPAVAFPMALRIMLSLPAEVARVDRWSATWPWGFATLGIALTTWAFGVPLPPGLGRPLALGLNLAVLVALLALLAVDYRRSGALGRRQLRWILLGFYLTATPPLFAAALALLVPPLWWIFEASQLSWLALPVCLFIAIDRFNAGDVDRLISASASYTILGGVLLAVLGVALPRTAAAVNQSMRVDPATAQVVVAIAFAAVLLPAHRALKPSLDRVMFPERQALEHGAAELRGALVRSEKLSELLDALGYELTQLLHPDCAAVYAPDGSVYAPIFAHGPGIVPAFREEGGLLRWLADERGPVRVARLGRRGRQARLKPLERAALEGMGVHVVLPVLGEATVAAFLCLGQKRSGDVYTQSDLEILRTIGERASDHVRTLEQARTQRRENERYERLRRYVPGALADRVGRDEALEEGEREVTVMFVDIRGYSSFAERRRVDAVFSVVNRYTETVTGIVTRTGGVVVEFNGDGMMAVFGALDPLPDKESAAVLAAREIVAQMPALGSFAGDKLEVGVGIASGSAFVGSIRGVDRHIWTALGKTTNLAARLQGLTRELDAWIVIDSPTWEACPAHVRDFQPHERFPVRGQLAPEDLFALPRNPSTPRD